MKNAIGTPKFWFMSAQNPFAFAAKQVSTRLQRISTMSWLNRSVLWVGLGIVGALVWWRLSVESAPSWLWIAGGLGVWLVMGIGFGWSKRQAGFQALSRWDDAIGGNNTLGSAQFFESLDEPTPGEALHLMRARKTLEEREKSLPRDLPIPVPHWNWAVLALIPVVMFIPGLTPNIALEDLLMGEAMRERAKAEAAAVAELRKDISKLDALTDEEKSRAEKLSEMLGETSQMLGKAGDRTAREVLEELEARARAAEKLAGELGGAEDSWASDEMIAEMAQHADTADLAAAIQERAPKLSGDEAAILAGKLQSQELKLEVRDRMDAALARTMEKASDDDKEKPIGEHVGNASGKLHEKQPKAAGQDFHNLAKHFREIGRRQKAQDDLKKLAEQLRQSGSAIAESQLAQMKALSGSEGEGGEGGADGESSSLPPAGAQELAQQAPLPQNMPQIPGMQPQPMPAPGQNQQAPGGQQPQQIPAPGTQPGPAPVPGMAPAPVPGQAPQPPGQGVGQQLGSASQPGQQPPGQGLMAPVPGQVPGAKQAQGAGLGQMRPGMVSGNGLEAGNGSAAMVDNKTETLGAAEDGMVMARVNEDGESTVKTIEGGVRQEGAERQAQRGAKVANYLSVEEQALDEQALPVSRKEQVLRYFTALRQQFEEEE